MLDKPVTICGKRLRIMGHVFSRLDGLRLSGSREVLSGHWVRHTFLGSTGLRQKHDYCIGDD